MAVFEDDEIVMIERVSFKKVLAIEILQKTAPYILIETFIAFWAPGRALRYNLRAKGQRGGFALQSLAQGCTIKHEDLKAER